jgi:ADP-heptose:LPS heptosyltransferase
LRESEKFRDYKITLCGNEVWRDLALRFDSEVVDDFIWIDKTRFLKRSDWTYTYKMLHRIHSAGFELLVDPNEVKTKLAEYIKKHSGVTTLIENNPIDLKEFRERLKQISNNRNDPQGSISLKDSFQFYQNKRFIDSVIEADSGLRGTNFELDHSGGRSKYIIIFPGAGFSNRIWSPKKFAELCKLIRKDHRTRILICGNEYDSDSAQTIIQESGITDIEDLTGQTTLPQLVSLISRTKLLISNETCAVHIASAVKANAVCISNGNHFGRFNPYPEEMSDNITTFYPEKITKNLHDFGSLISQYAVGSDLDINSISAEEVYSCTAKYLKKTVSRNKAFNE